MRTLLYRCLTAWLMVAALACGPGGASERRSAAATPTPTPPPRPARIEGQVLLQGSNDASGTQVFVPGTQLVSFTGENGRYALHNVPAGAWQVMARAEGFQSATLGQVTIADADTTRVHTLAAATLKPRAPERASAATAGGSIAGAVTLNGLPFADTGAPCIVELNGTPYRTTCDATGRFLLWNIPPDQYQLLVSLSGFEPLRRPVRVLPGDEPTSVAVDLAPAQPAATRAIRGNVEMVGPDGELTNDFDRVLVRIVGRDDLVGKLQPDGAFALERLAPARYVVTAEANGYDPASPIEVDLVELPEIGVTLTLISSAATTSTAQARITGVARKNVADLQDMSGIAVSLTGSSLGAVTDREGRYTIDNVPAGQWQLLAQAEGFASAEQTLDVAEDAGAIEAAEMVLEPSVEYPRVMQVDPRDGAEEVAIRPEMPIMIRFNKKMDPDSLRRAIGVEPRANFRVFSGRQLPDTDFDLAKVIIFGTGEQPFARFETRYAVTVGTEATDVEGLAMQEPFRMEFETGRPAIIRSIPADGERAWPGSAMEPIVFFVNARLDPQTVSTDNVRIYPRIPTPPVAGIMDPETGWTRIQIQGTWKPDTRYRVTIQRGVRTAGGNALANTPYTITFRTARMVPRVGVPPTKIVP